MADTILIILQASAVASIFTYMFSRGLSVRPGDLRYLEKRPGLLLRSLLSIDVFVPLIAMMVIVLMVPARATAIGLLILASSPAAPLVLRKIAKAGGSKEYAVSLHILLAALAIVTTPATLALLSEAASLRLGISSLAVAEQLGLSILVPIMAGMTLRWLFPALAQRISGPLEALSNVVLALVILIVLLSMYPLLLALDIRSYLAITLMISGAVLAGHLMAAGSPEEQTTLALESSSRNVGLALVIASTYAPLENALPILVPYLVISTFLGLIYIRYQKRRMV
ncbi:bile acid:sodium symporter family protein [Methanocella sp. MCL-LM]|uniref:bile acid:sodium symporter family protein n=1 Tax=Methanocella sp. MCL-LM TaxID=3412035 RepID=UPI003C7644AC